MRFFSARWGGPKWEHLPPAEQPERAALLPLRKRFSLFANIRPGLLFPELIDASPPLKRERIPEGIDIVCIRELTGGIYFGQPKETRLLENGETEAIDTMVYKTSEIERIAEVAAQTAKTRSGKVLLRSTRPTCSPRPFSGAKTVTAYFAQHHPKPTALAHVCRQRRDAACARSEPIRCALHGKHVWRHFERRNGGHLWPASPGMMASASLGTGGKHPRKKPFGLYEPAGGTAPDIAGKKPRQPLRSDSQRRPHAPPQLRVSTRPPAALRAPCAPPWRKGCARATSLLDKSPSARGQWPKPSSRGFDSE